MAILTIHGLTHDYGKHRALQDVSATLDNGVTALIGPNGAGKTTLIRVLVGLLQPTEGSVQFNGESLHTLGKAYYRHVGYCPQAPRFYPNFTARQFLLYMGAMKELPKRELKARIDTLLELVNLREQRDHKITTFSGGMKQRLGIAQALLNDPDLLILDEPTAGLDPNERIRFRNLLAQIGAERIVLLATHIISDVESIARRVLLLKQGRLLVDDAPEQVLKTLENQVWRIPGVAEEELPQLAQRYTVSNVRQDATGYEIRVIQDDRPDPAASPVPPSLEDVFLFYFREGQGEEP